MNERVGRLPPIAANSSPPLSAGERCTPTKQDDVVDCRAMSRSSTQNQNSNPRNTRPHGLSPRQRMAALLLVQGKSVAAAAQSLGIDPRTIFRWKKQPLFVAAIDQSLTAAPDKSRNVATKPRRNAPILCDDEDDDDSADLSQPSALRDRMEEIMALSGYIPTWRRNADKPAGTTDERR